MLLIETNNLLCKLKRFLLPLQQEVYYCSDHISVVWFTDISDSSFQA